MNKFFSGLAILALAALAFLGGAWVPFPLERH